MDSADRRLRPVKADLLPPATKIMPPKGSQLRYALDGRAHYRAKGEWLVSDSDIRSGRLAGWRAASERLSGLRDRMGRESSRKKFPRPGGLQGRGGQARARTPLEGRRGPGPSRQRRRWTCPTGPAGTALGRLAGGHRDRGPVARRSAASLGAGRGSPPRGPPPIALCAASLPNAVRPRR